MSKPATPFVFGLIIGAVVITVLGLSNSWVITESAKNVEVKNTWINAQASICASLASAHLKANKSAVSLDGNRTEARNAREDLAKAFAVTLQGKETVDSIVITACARMLNKPDA